MKTLTEYALLSMALIFAATSTAQGDARDENEELKIAAIEALISAPAERALPLVNKVLSGNHSDELKERALFILSQIDAAGAQATLLDFASNASGELQEEAIRMIGIGGDEVSMAKLKSIYQSGDSEAREAVLEAYMIAGDKQSVFDIAVTATGDDFEEAVDMLGAMDAREELHQLLSQTGASEALIDAYAVSGDLETLRKLALDTSDPDMQAQAIEAMGVVGGDEVNATLVQIYRDASTEDVREAALDGMLIADYDAGVLELYRSSDDPVEKRQLLEYLVHMESDEVWAIIDSTLDAAPGGEL